MKLQTAAIRGRQRTPIPGDVVNLGLPKNDTLDFLKTRGIRLAIVFVLL